MSVYTTDSHESVCLLVTCSLSLHTTCRYGVVLRELGCHSEAREAQLSSLSLQPLFWGAWSELATLCESREMVSGKKTGGGGWVISVLTI